MTKKLAEEKFSQAVSFNSLPVFLDSHSNVSVQIVAKNGTALASTVKLQVGNDINFWEDLAGSSATISGTAGSQFYDIQTNAGQMRVVVTITGGVADFKIDYVLKK